MEMKKLNQLIAGLGLLTLACGCSTQSLSKTASAGTKAAAATSVISGPTDNEIVHILTTANTGETEAAQIAKSKSKNKKVIEFADMMIADHTKTNDEIKMLNEKLGLEPSNNAVSITLSAGANSTNSSLKKLKGKKLDQAYADQQVSMHQSLLDMLDKTLIPKAKDSELKAEVEKIRTAVAEHLDHAKQLEASIVK
jgi:putative membrane protein